MISSKTGYFSLVAQLVESTVRTLARPSAVTFENVIVQIRSIGVGAIPASSLIAVTAGFVLALVLELQLSQIGKVEIVPSLLWVILTEQVVPVGVALMVFTAEHAGIYAVATLPTERKHGASSALMARAIADAKAERGFPPSRVCLQVMAGSYAEGFYERLGFKPRFQLEVFARPA